MGSVSNDDPSMGWLEWTFLANFVYFAAATIISLIFGILDMAFGVKVQISEPIAISAPVSLSSMFVLVYFVVNKKRY